MRISPGLALGWIVAAWVGVSAPAAGADDAAFVQRVNAIYEGRDRAVTGELRADQIVLSAVAAMQASPEGASPALRAALATPKSSDWGELEGWAAAAEQQAAIGALRKAGEPGKRMSYLQPYGSGVDGELRAKGLFTDLGEPPILAAARFGHLKGLDRLCALVQVEATRLGETGKASEALTLTVAWTHFSRLLADREFSDEMRWGLRNMTIGLERTLDIVRTYGDQLTDAQVGAAIESLSERNLSLDRLRLPRGERIAGEQILARAFVERGGASDSGFGSTMALVTSSERPLLQFGEAARWQAAASGHAGTFDTTDQLAGVFKDFELRWGLRPDDRILKSASEFERMDANRYAAVARVSEGFPTLFGARQQVITEAAGTRMALAAAAFKIRHGTFAVALSAARPAYIKTVEKDPYVPAGAEFHYFVPIRDQPRGARDLPKPHVVRVGGADVARQKPVIPEEITEDALRGAIEQLAPSAAAEKKAAAAIKAAGFDRSKIGPVLTEYYSSITGPSIGAILAGGSFWTQILGDVSSNEPTAAGVYSSFVRTLYKELKQKNELRQAYEELLERRPQPKGSGLEEAGDVPLGGANTFSASLDDTTFVLYSSGPNRARDWAREVGHGGADLLIWPPVISLLRDHLGSGASDVGEMTGPWTLHGLMPFVESEAETPADAKSGQTDSGGAPPPVRLPPGG